MAEHFIVMYFNIFVSSVINGFVTKAGTCSHLLSPNKIRCADLSTLLFNYLDSDYFP